MKKNYLLLISWVLFFLPAFSQNIAINTDASLPNSNAILDIKSGSKGLLIPRMSSAARIAIPNTRGLLVYDTTTNSFWYNTGTQWQGLATGAAVQSLSVTDSVWLINGNSNVHDTVNFLGTINNVPLNIRVNNQRSGRIDPTRADTYWGYRAGASDTGNNNTANGYQALRSNTSGNFNTAGGSGSLFSNVDGFVNTAYGFQSLYSNTSGYRNTATGVNALRSNTTGTNNTANGYQALYSTTTVNNLTGTGFQALYSNTSGTQNVANGYQSLYANTTGSQNTADGYQSLYTSTTGSGNTANGFESLYTNILGNNNTAMGSGALNNNNHGSGNTAIGFEALNTNSFGNDNTAMGSGALHNNGGGGNTAIGSGAMYANGGGLNTAIGAGALASGGGGVNTACGYQSLYSNGSGYFNTAYGYQSLYSLTDAWNNVAVGSGALYSNTTGYFNTAMGDYSLSGNTGGDNNTAIGYNANVGSGSLTNATAIGSRAVVDASNKVRIGNSAVTVIEGQVPFTTPSDGRFKFHVQEDVKGLDFILQLRPVTYQFDTKRFDAQLNHQTNKTAIPESYAVQTAYEEASKIRRSGFIAQEVEKAADASGYDFSGIIKPKTDQDHYSLSYDAFVVPLVKAVQDQQQLIEAQDKKIAGLQQQLDEIKKLLQHSK